MTNPRLPALILAGAALVAVLTGCTPGGDAKPDAGAKPAASQPAPKLDPVIKLNDSAGARSDLSDYTCGAEGTTWAASGTVKNSTDQKATYVVNVGVIDKGTRSSLVRKNFVFDLEPGASESFSEAKLLEGVDKAGRECVVRVNRGSGVAG